MKPFHDKEKWFNHNLDILLLTDPIRPSFGRPFKKVSRKGKISLNKTGHRNNPHPKKVKKSMRG